MIFWLTNKFGIWFTLIFVFVVFSPSLLLAQFSGYSQSDASAYNAALFSNGAGLRDSLSNLSGNPAFLISHGKNLTEVGGAGVSSQKAVGPVILNGGGFYTLNESFGFGVRLKPVYTRFFPADERMINYTGQTFISYKFSDILFASIGIGPTVSNRPGGFSSYSINAFGSLGIIYHALTAGIVFESPGSNRFNNYLGTEILKERYPEKVSIGIQYQIYESFFVYGELVRTFWERAMFSQNGLEEKPPFPVSTSYTGSLGFGYRVLDQFGILLGFSKLANATQGGALDPLYGLSIGLKGEILPSIFGSGCLGSIYLQRIGINKTIEPFEPETRFGFQFQFLYDVHKDDINTPK